MTKCPHCDEQLPAVVDAFCPAGIGLFVFGTTVQIHQGSHLGMRRT